MPKDTFPLLSDSDRLCLYKVGALVGLLSGVTFDKEDAAALTEDDVAFISWLVNKLAKGVMGGDNES